MVPAAMARQQSANPAPDVAKKLATNSAPAKTAATKPHTTAKTSSTTAKPANSTHTASSGKRSSHKKTARARGQQKIDSERATSIQQALIREHYLSGEPAGSWNQASEDAMRRYQSDHGWQTKEVPDSRALIKLGLGPSHDHLLNPESAMTTAPEPLTPIELDRDKPTSKPAANSSDTSKRQ
jgi:hypothetical protein